MATTLVDDIHQLLRLRRSGRAYDLERAVSDHDMNALFEAARWAPSANNLQPWRYLYAHKGGAGYERLLLLLSSHNREWAQNAPVLVLSGALTLRPNGQGELVHSPTALHDIGLANMALTVEATQRGLMVHMIGGFDVEAARDLLPRDIHPTVMMAIGYPGDVSLLSENNQMREAAPRHRKLLDEFVTKV